MRCERRRSPAQAHPRMNVSDHAIPLFSQPPTIALQHRCRTSLGKTCGIRLVPGQIGKICAALAANLDVAIRGLRLTYRRAFTVIVSGGPATLVARPAHFRVTALRWCRPLL